MRVYILADSNIFIKFLELGYKDIDEDPAALEALLSVIHDEKAVLVLPEIVLLEWEKLYIEKREELSMLFDEIFVKPSVDNSRLINTLKKDMAPSKKVKMNDQGEMAALTRKIFESSKKIIPLTSSILLAAFKRGISAKKPIKDYKDKANRFIPLIQPDCIVIESAVVALKQEKKCRFIMCTNDPDFESLKNKGELHDHIMEEFNQHDVKLYKSLTSLLNEEFGLSLNLNTVSEEVRASPEIPPMDEEEGKSKIVGSKIESSVKSGTPDGKSMN